MMQSWNKSVRGVRMWALVTALGVGSVSLAAQVQMIKEDAPPPTMPTLKTASANTIRVSQNILRGMAEGEPDIAAPDGVTESGMVGVLVLVSKTGAVQEVVATFGLEELRKAAVDGVMGWSYKPFLLNGEPREVQSAIMLQFNGGVGKRAVMGVAGMAGMTGGVAGNVGLGPAGGQGGGGSVRVASGVIAGLALAQPAPVYPPIAKAAHVQGVVILHALISKNGTVENLQVISGPPMLVAAAIDAVRLWRYRPYLLNGQPTEVETTINVNFTFAEPPKPPDAAGATDAPADAQ